MTKTQAIEAMRLKIKHYDISYAELSREHGCTRQYVHACLNGGQVKLDKLLDINIALDRIVNERQAALEALESSIKTNN